MDIFSFVYRGNLTKLQLDRVNPNRKYEGVNEFDARVLEKLPLSDLDPIYIKEAQKMSSVFILISAFENMVRDFIKKVLLESVGEDWWNTKVPEKIRKSVEIRKKDEQRNRWHNVRGGSEIHYIDFGDLALVIENNFEHFEMHIPSIDWVRQIFSSLEKSRNVLMHSGQLSIADIERIGMCVRDWTRQVG